MASTWLGWDKARSIIDALVFWLGVLKALWEYNREKSTRHLGRQFLNKDSMGDFGPHPTVWTSLSWFNPFCPRKLGTPRILTVSGLIKAGDQGVYTSSMFDWIPPNYAEVSWVPMHEAFIDEIAWQTTQDNNVIPATSPKELRQYQKKAAKRLSDRLAKFRKKQTEDHRIPGINALRDLFSSPQTHDPKILAFQSQPHDVEFSSQELQDIDRHLLYYTTSLVCENQPKNQVTLPYLVRCLRALSNVRPPQKPHGLEDRRAEKWFNLFQTLWIHNEKPCIETSREEISALAFILGIQLTSNDYMPSGVGMSHIALTSDKADAITTFRLVYGRRGPLDDPAVGSGYFTLFAKHLSCGCLPFAQIARHRAVQTIVVSRNVLSEIKRGNSVAGRRDFHIPSLPGPSYLERLPMASSINYFVGCEVPPSGAQKGLIYDVDSNYVRGAECYCVRDIDCTHKITWAHAVAGIAFGGLVPMASVSLIEAVRFTVGAVEDLRQSFQLLERIIGEIHHQSQRGLNLFGKNQGYWSALLDADVLDYDTDPKDCRKKIQRFGRYSTLLERLTAMYPRASSPFAKSRLEDVFEACRFEVQNHYEHAVEKFQPRFGEDVLPSPNMVARYTLEAHTVELDLEDILGKVQHDHSLRVEEIGKLARCIISVWTHTVSVTIWEEIDKKDAEQSGTSRGRYFPVPLEDLPDVSAWK